MCISHLTSVVLEIINNATTIPENQAEAQSAGIGNNGQKTTQHVDRDITEHDVGVGNLEPEIVDG